MRRTTAALWLMTAALAAPGIARTPAEEAPGSSMQAGRTTSAQPVEDEPEQTPEEAEAARLAGPFANLTFRFIGPPGNRVTALGTCYGPQPERGVYRTTDGGEHWQRVLFVDENTGASDLAMDPKNPRVLFAGTWQIDIKTWGRKSGGPGSGVFVSRDGGTTWK